MTNEDFIVQTLKEYHADVLNILKCPYGTNISFCTKLGDCTKCKIQWLRMEYKQK